MLCEGAEQARAGVEELAAHLRELDEESDNLRITREALLGLTEEPLVTEAVPQSATPGHPAYQRILAAFADPVCHGPWSWPRPGRRWFGFAVGRVCPIGA